MGRALEERVFLFEKEREIGRIELQNQTEKRIAKLTYQNQITRLWAVATVAILGGLSLFGIYWLRQQKRLAEKEKAIIAAQEQVKTMALAQAKYELVEKDMALLEVTALLELKNNLIFVTVCFPYISKKL